MVRNIGHNSVLQAVYTLLSTSYTVYDYVPETAVFPFVSFGIIQSNSNDIEDKHAYGRDVIIEVNCWSRNAGFKEVCQMAETISGLFDSPGITISGFTLVKTDINVETSLDLDGITRRSRLEITFKMAQN